MKFGDNKGVITYSRHPFMSPLWLRFMARDEIVELYVLFHGANSIIWHCYRGGVGADGRAGCRLALLLLALRSLKIPFVSGLASVCASVRVNECTQAHPLRRFSSLARAAKSKQKLMMQSKLNLWHPNKYSCRACRPDEREKTRRANRAKSTKSCRRIIRVCLSHSHLSVCAAALYD